MNEEAKKALIDDFAAMVNNDRVVDIETGIRPFVEIGEPMKEQMVITYIVKGT